MARSWQENQILGALLGAFTAVSVVLVLTVAAASSAQAQTFTVLHTFTGGADGSNPSAGGVTGDSAGNLYGTTSFGGLQTSSCTETWRGHTGCGTVYKMRHTNSGWIFSVLYSFNGATDGYSPNQMVSFGPDGILYGSTFYGPTSPCTGYGCGTVFKLQPPAAFCRAASCPWAETVLHRFQGAPNDGTQPAWGHLVFDSAGNLYSTTYYGGRYGYGIVYELTPGSGWTESVLHNFTNGLDGAIPTSSVIFDNAGNLYGTTADGGAFGFGVIFQLTQSESGWTENVLHAFQPSADGSAANGSLVLDSSGNLYGTAGEYGPKGGGTVWELSPANGGWTFTVLYAFEGSDSDGPSGGLLMDQAGNLYGATSFEGAYGYGNVFKLSPANGGWSYTSLYDFTGGSDGVWPGSKLTMDAHGNLFGTTYSGGSEQGLDGDGVVWEITP